ncbi:hypothetical protein L2735_18455 [Shewanella olleyana]|uniref:hypothetical protein n=1 Tax=Shewanella olleyana TaxID=135626 RepID=UPI00200E5983|nr:hypothetical protein [Shewanella olleyana]MCL1068753.1 hypothetical protein [Shewanella olleyana]
MLTRLARFILTKLGRVVFVSISIAIFCLVILFLEHFADSRSVWAFDCNSKIYQFKNQNGEVVHSQNEPLYLSLTIQDELISLDYFTGEEENEREFISLEGNLKELEVGKMMYQLDLKVIDANYQLDAPQLQNYLAKELDVMQESLILGNEISVAVQVLEMDTEKEYILIKFSPYHTLWACRLLE